MTGRPAAPLIARLLCVRCGHSVALAACTCRPPNPAQLAAEVAYRHRVATRRARHNTPEETR